jgi:hypothetical protein
LLPSIYPLRNRCLAINNSSLLVSANESCTRCLATARLEHTYFLRYFGPLGRMPHFSLLILFLILIQSGKRGKWNYAIHGKIVMPEHTHTYIHTHTHTHIQGVSQKSWNIYIYIYFFFFNLLMISVQSVNILQSTVREQLHIFFTDSPMPGMPPQRPRREPHLKLLSRPLG